MDSATNFVDGPNISSAEANATVLVPVTGILVETTITVLSCSCRFSPTPARSMRTGIPCFSRILHWLAHLITTSKGKL